MEKLVGYVKVPVYVGDDGELYTEPGIFRDEMPEEEED